MKLKGEFTVELSEHATWVLRQVSLRKRKAFLASVLIVII
jgi:hypothetical protein